MIGESLYCKLLLPQKKEAFLIKRQARQEEETKKNMAQILDIAEDERKYQMELQRKERDRFRLGYHAEQDFPSRLFSESPSVERKLLSSGDSSVGSFWKIGSLVRPHDTL